MQIILFFSTWVSEMLGMKIIGLTELLFGGDAELARGAIPLVVFLEFVGRMIYDTSRSESHKQSLFDRWRRQLTNQK